jgi:hypothetical protein
MSKEWSILIVNYKSHIYLKWQLKILYEFNDPAIFNLIIVDNSVDESEKKDLNKTLLTYKKKYKNIKTIFHKPIYKAASGQHGEAIDIAKKDIKTKYTLIHDPDFFWLKKDYLNWLKKLLSNTVAVGAPYPKPVALGQKHFPSAFGCAYNSKDIANISFAAYLDGKIEKSWKTFYASSYYKKGYDFYYDVGWRVREKLSKDVDSNFISFSQKSIKNKILELLKIKESHSFETLTTAYSWNCQVIAAHLFRGSFTGSVKLHCDPNLKVSKMQHKIRNEIGKLMYKEVKTDCLQLNNIINKLENDEQTISLKLLILQFLLCLKKIKLLKILVPVKTSYIKKQINNCT